MNQIPKTSLFVNEHGQTKSIQTPGVKTEPAAAKNNAVAFTPNRSGLEAMARTNLQAVTGTN
ncbi:MAG: hypothetical protein MK033_06680 [Candidatus Caenarcaniphilales bacterium]|nr:hypothetical protein [Candidatus Caenarcaniphilales bacterium]